MALNRQQGHAVQGHAGQAHAGQAHAVQAHAVQAHAGQGHACIGHAGLGHAGQGHTGLVNGVKPTTPQTVTLPGEVGVVAAVNGVSSTPRRSVRSCVWSNVG